MNEDAALSRDVPAHVLQQAAEWFVRLRTVDPDAKECSDWFAWIEENPEHRAAFAQIQQSWDLAGATASPAWPTPEELATAPGPRTGSRIGFSRRFMPLAIAAGLAVVAIGITIFGVSPITRLAQQWLGERISTQRGEPQSALLEDGSRVELGGLTNVAVRFTPERRLIVAGEGETYYRVARDPARPFVVQSGPVSITALGTAFSVRREGASVSVSVSEGLVEVKPTDPPTGGSHLSAVRATAGERVKFEGGELSPASGTAAQDSWRRGRLRFEDEPLRVVVASINRYAERPIEIGDPAVAELHFTGTVASEAIDRWLSSIEIVFPIEVRRDEERILIEPAAR